MTPDYRTHATSSAGRRPGWRVRAQAALAAFVAALAALGILPVPPAVSLPTPEPALADHAPFTMVIASDPQYDWWRGEKDQNCNSAECIRRMAEETNQEMFKAMNAVTELERWPESGIALGRGDSVRTPTAAIINGDLTAFWHPYQARRYQQLYSYVTYPLYPGLGNHDYANNVDHCYGEWSPGVAQWLDRNHCAKDAIWYMAGLIDDFRRKGRIVNKDWPGLVRVRNDAGFATTMKVTYTTKRGEVVRKDHSSFSGGEQRFVGIPAGSRMVDLWVGASDDSWSEGFSWPDDTRNCYVVQGALGPAGPAPTLKPEPCDFREWPSEPWNWPSYVHVTNHTGLPIEPMLRWQNESGFFTNRGGAVEWAALQTGQSRTIAFPLDAVAPALAVTFQDRSVSDEIYTTDLLPRAQNCFTVVRGARLPIEATKADCPREVDLGAMGSMSYSFEIGNYHFVQLQNRPSWTHHYPKVLTPSAYISTSYEWLRDDVMDATA
ncbi:MAG: hypothetical protein M3133_07345, partial [Actinomycetota bacterium]|nr:hypothetical protein [Actinomycetota bacterium]